MIVIIVIVAENWKTNTIASYIHIKGNKSVLMVAQIAENQ
jgi:hypothetical protein